jgi:transketolase
MTMHVIKKTALKNIARDTRIDILNMCEQTGAGHVGSAFSVVEILLVLYSEVVKGKYPDPDRDRVILGKGHAGTALYSILTRIGKMDELLFKTFSTNGSRLGHHPHYEPSEGLDANTGSLGHGLSIGSGLAYASHKQRSPSRTFVVLSDGDTNEGSTWEAAAFASHHRLSNLCMILDNNKMQAMGFAKDILFPGEHTDRWRSFGWDTIEVDGHDVKQLLEAFTNMGLSGRPLAIIANTIKGKGVSFMENNLLWHYRTPKGAEYFSALEELSR